MLSTSFFLVCLTIRDVNILVFSAKGNQLQTAKTTIVKVDSCLNYPR